MIVNTAVSPFADERKNKAMVDIFLPDGTLLKSFGAKDVLEISLIQEFQARRSSSPRSETSIVFDNRNKYFDITNPESAIHSITDRGYCDIYLSSTERSADDAFVKKSRCFYDGISESGVSFSLKFIDVLSCKGFENIGMLYVFGGVSDVSVGDLVESIKQVTGCRFETDIPEDIAEKIFSRRAFFTYDSSGTPNGYMNLNEGLTLIAQSVGSDETRVYLVSDRDGKLSYVKQQTEPSQTITKKHFIDCEIVQGEGCLISKISDRGNILYQLGDVVEVDDGSKIFKTEIYKIHYRFSRGSLSSEWEGEIVQ